MILLFLDSLNKIFFFLILTVHNQEPHIFKGSYDFQVVIYSNKSIEHENISYNMLSDLRY